MQKTYLVLLLLLLSGCASIVDEFMGRSSGSIDVEEDKFTGETFICSQSINERRTTLYYKICRYKKIDGSHKDYIHGRVEYAAPVPIEYSAAIDANKQKLKIKSRDDRRRGITINDFTIFLPEGYVYKNDNIEIKIYGVNDDAVLIVSARIIMALREKIKEIEG